MNNESSMAQQPAEERRSGRDRRTGKNDELFRYAVAAGFFLDMRKNPDRRARN